jgi:hypothetical protein
MGLKLMIKKAEMAIGGLLLACNIGCQARFQEAIVGDGLEQAVQPQIEAKEKKTPLWQYPVNILGGIFVSGSVHEGSHALAALSMGKKIEEVCLPFMPNDYRQVLGYTISDDLNDTHPDSSNNQKAFYRIAGPLGDVALIESINYNLRNGKISKNHQPFWATTSLATRALLLHDALKGLYSEDVLHAINDFRGLENVSGITVEQSAGAIGLYTLLNYKKIKQEFNAATGRKYYPENKKRESSIEAVPVNNGLALQYRRHF